MEQAEKRQRIQNQHTKRRNSDTKTGEDIFNKRIIVVDTIVMRKRIIEKKLKEKLHAREKTSIMEYMIRCHLLEHIADE